MLFWNHLTSLEFYWWKKILWNWALFITTSNLENKTDNRKQHLSFTFQEVLDFLFALHIFLSKWWTGFKLCVRVVIFWIIFKGMEKNCLDSTFLDLKLVSLLLYQHSAAILKNIKNNQAMSQDLIMSTKRCFIQKFVYFTFLKLFFHLLTNTYLFPS